MAEFRITLKETENDLAASFQEARETFDADFGDSSVVHIVEKDHTKLKNRDAKDQHPIEAITNLGGELDVRSSTGISNTEIWEILQM